MCNECKYQMKKVALLFIFYKIRNNASFIINHNSIEAKRIYAYKKKQNQNDYYKRFPISATRQNINYCDTCKYHMPFPNTNNVYGLQFSKCKKFIHDDISKENKALSLTTQLTSKSLFEYFEFCKDCRIDELKCGENGKYYESINIHNRNIKK